MATATASRASARLPEAKNVGSALDRALDAGKGILRLSPTWVPRSFLHPGKRVRLRFDMGSQASTPYMGAYIDELRVTTR